MTAKDWTRALELDLDFPCVGKGTRGNSWVRLTRISLRVPGIVKR